MVRIYFPYKFDSLFIVKAMQFFAKVYIATVNKIITK